MNFTVFGIAGALLASSAAASQAQVHSAAHETAPAHKIYSPSDVNWQPGPPSLPPGAQFAVLEGDPANAEFFTMQLKFPSGYVVPPHWHPVQERVTVLSGTLLFGIGETADMNSAERLPAGSYFSMPPGMRHFAAADGETVIQLTSMGPWAINYVNPADDPRR